MIMKIKSVSLVTSTVQALNSDVFMGTQSVKHASSQVNTRKKSTIPSLSKALSESCQLGLRASGSLQDLFKNV